MASVGSIASKSRVHVTQWTRQTQSTRETPRRKGGGVVSAEAQAVPGGKTTVEARHPALGLSDQDVLEVYYYIALASTPVDRLWDLQHASIAMFLITCSGHAV